MNFEIIALELVILLAAFTVLTFGLLFISPLTFITDYPPEIQEKYYRSQNKQAVRKKLTVIMLIKKVIAFIILLFVLAWMLHTAGAKTFMQGFSLALFFISGTTAWDTFFLDWALFANIKRIRLPGTEHMDREYHQKWFHVKVRLPMIPVFFLMGAVSSWIMLSVWM